MAERGEWKINKLEGGSGRRKKRKGVVGGSGGRKWREEAGVGMIVTGKRGRKGGSKKGRLWWREGVSEGKE